jgi:non-ribosomal peptide synthetase component F
MNQDFSFELLMDQLRKTRDHIPPTLFDVLVNFQDRRGEISGAVIDLPGIQTIDLPIPLDSGKRDLTFYINVFPSSTRISLVYDADLFRPEFMEGFLERFRSVLAAVLENPNNTLREIRWRSMKEKERSDRAQFIHAAMQDISEDF